MRIDDVKPNHLLEWPEVFPNKGKSRMDVKLIVKKGSTKVRVVPLRGNETIVGRRADCDLRIESAAISRRHCLIRIQNTSVTVEDLDSANGTFVNGAQIKGKQSLKSGDQLQVGPLCFSVKFDATASPGKTKPPGANGGPASKSKVPAAKPSSGSPKGSGFVPTRVLPAQQAEPAEELDFLPLVEEEETAMAMSVKTDPDDPGPSASFLEALDVAEPLDSDADWNLPDADELRGLLSRMDDDDEKPVGKTKR